MFLPGEPDRLLVLLVRGVLLPALHLALLGLLEVWAGDSSIALRPQHLPPSLLAPELSTQMEDQDVAGAIRKQLKA